MVSDSKVTNTENSLKSQLGAVGYRQEFLDSIWPSWWTDEADSDQGAQADLRFLLSRRLGLSPKSLLGDRIEFVWDDSITYHRLASISPDEQSLLESFGRSLSRILIRATDCPSEGVSVTPQHARDTILNSGSNVDLKSLLALCWGIGIPVVQIRNWPLEVKSMDAMVVCEGNRYAVLIGRYSKYPARIVFILAHELGHVFCGHLSGKSTFIDVAENEVDTSQSDESEATQFALELLTGSREPEISKSEKNLGAKALARMVLSAGHKRKIDPGTLALCLGYQTNRWHLATAALDHIYSGDSFIPHKINGTARRQLNWESLSTESEEYLGKVLQIT